jgi:hypothetical protein
MTQLIYPGKGSPVTNRVGGCLGIWASLDGFREEKSLFFLSGIETKFLHGPARSLVAVLTAPLGRALQLNFKECKKEKEAT